LKRKLAGGSGVVFKKPGEESDGEDAEPRESEEAGQSTETSAPQPPQDQPAMKVEEREIIIHDDD
jgi:hypothetical protein